MNCFNSFEHNVSLFISKSDTIVVKTIIESTYKNYNIRIMQKTEVENERDKIVSFHRL
jgi:hypothetical protein